jgi:hypothetical protein
MAMKLAFGHYFQLTLASESTYVWVNTPTERIAHPFFRGKHFVSHWRCSPVRAWSPG